MGLDIIELKRVLSECDSDEKKIELLLREIKAKRYSFDFIDMEPFVYQLIELSRKFKNDSQLAQAYDGLGAIFFFKDQYDLSLEYGFKALELNEKHLDYATAAINLHLIGLIYFRMNNEEMAEKYFLKSCQYNTEFPNVYCNLGLLYYDRKIIDKSIYYLDKGLEIAKKQKNNSITAMALYYKALVNYYNEDYSISIEYLNSAWEVLEKESETYLRLSILIEKANLYLATDREDEALAILQESAELASRYNRNNQLCRTWYMISGIYEKKEDFEKAFEFLELASNLEKSMRDQTKTTRFSEIQTRYEVETDNVEMMQLINQSSRLASVGVVTGGIVHEINQPLSAIKINCDSILYWYKRNLGGLPDVIVDQLNDINTSVSFISSIIDQIRNFWKTSSQVIEKTEVNMNVFITGKIASIKKKLMSQDIMIEVKNCNDVLYSEIDGKYFEQIMLHMINICYHLLKKTQVLNEKRIVISLSHEVDFNIIKILLPAIRDVNFEQILNEAVVVDDFKSILLDFKISKYFLNQFNGFITYSEKPSFFRISIPGRCEKKI